MNRVRAGTIEVRSEKGAKKCHLSIIPHDFCDVSLNEQNAKISMEARAEHVIHPVEVWVSICVTNKYKDH